MNYLLLKLSEKLNIASIDEGITKYKDHTFQQLVEIRKENPELTICAKSENQNSLLIFNGLGVLTHEVSLNCPCCEFQESCCESEESCCESEESSDEDVEDLPMADAEKQIDKIREKQMQSIIKFLERADVDEKCRLLQNLLLWTNDDVSIYDFENKKQYTLQDLYPNGGSIQIEISLNKPYVASADKPAEVNADKPAEVNAI